MSPTTTSIALPIAETTGVGEARRLAATLAAELELDEVAAGKVSIVVSEIATNLAKYATDGVLLLRAAREGGARAVEVLSIDRGPGMFDVEECLRDGFSTKGTAGSGLGAVRRQSTTFDLVSERGVGTILFARVGLEPKNHTPFEIGAICTPIAGESACGDAWRVLEDDDGAVTALVADGLGHGALAAQAADAATAILSRTPESARSVVEAAHSALKPTRGAAVAVARVERDRSHVDFAGVGNVVARVYDGDTTHSGLSHAGVVGHNATHVRSFALPWGDRALLVMHSDGVASHWQMERYASLVGRHPALLAGALFRDHRRGRDDATILVLRTRSNASKEGAW